MNGLDKMKSPFLIIIGIITIGVIVASTIGTIQIQSVHDLNCNSDGGYVVGFLRCTYIHEDYGLPYDENTKYLVEQLFMEALEETIGDNLHVREFLVIKSQNNEPKYDNYCGFAHLENNEVWFDADFAENRIIRASIVDPPPAHCEDDDHSCFCDLQEKLNGERKNYEEFFRDHVSGSCPIIPIPENATSFDPSKCDWIENER